MQGIQEQARQPMNFCSTLIISQDAIIHTNLYSMLDTALAYVDCQGFFLFSFCHLSFVLFYIRPTLHCSFMFNSDTSHYT